MLTNDQRVSVSLFYPILAGMLIPPPTFVAKDKIIEALSEFCRESHVWREALGVGVTTANWSEIELDLPPNTDFAGWIEIRQMNSDILPAEAFELSGPRTVTMNSEVAGTGMFQVFASVAPTPGIKEVPETLFNRYSYEIATGAAARLAQMPGEEWSAPQHVSNFRKIFTNGISSASRFALENYQSQPSATRLNRDNISYF